MTALVSSQPRSKELARHDEMVRQRLILLREMPERLVLSALAFAICAAFVPVWPLLLVLALHLAAEAIGPWLQRAERMQRSSRWYAAAMAQMVLVDTTYMTAAGMVWQVETPFAKAYAVGMATMALMRLATVRSIHLPSGVAGLVGATGTALVANTIYWMERGDIVATSLSTAAAFGALAYTLTAMLSNHRLHRSMANEEASARAAHEAKSLFLAQMSHELRTPLNAIIGMGHAELAGALRQNPNSLRSERLNLLVGNARTMASILDDVTDLNADGAARLRLRPRIINLYAEVDALVAGFREKAARAGVPLVLECGEFCPEMVSIDAVRFRQCLGNLLSNAIRHAPDGSILAHCQALPCASGKGGILTFDVSDTGPGVPESQREAIFEPFHKGREATPGTGLGLAISRRLARLMGGDLALIPSAIGAHFRLSLRYELSAPPLPDTAPPDLSGRRILVVDDIATNRLVAATYLRSWHARVLEAATGEEALHLLATDEPDLMLLDMNMPGLDGYETARRARMMAGRMTALPIVAMTADVGEADIRAFRQAGADGHLAKPLLPETLATELRRLLT